MLLQGTVSAPMWNSLHSPSQLPYKASVVTLPLPFWLLLFFSPPLGVTFPVWPFPYARQALSAAAGSCWDELSLLWCYTTPWARCNPCTSSAGTRGDSGSVNFSPLCKPSLILTTPQPFLCTHRHVLHSQPTNSQVLTLPLFFLLLLLFFNFALGAFFPPSGPLLLPLHCSCAVQSLFLQVLKWPSGLASLSSRTWMWCTEKGADCAHWSLPALLFLYFFNLAHSSLIKEIV